MKRISLSILALMLAYSTSAFAGSEFCMLSTTGDTFKAVHLNPGVSYQCEYANSSYVVYGDVQKGTGNWIYSTGNVEYKVHCYSVNGSCEIKRA